mmetsp:Transcript_16870/g.23605  ORF Transcript_16870/g.23605 Transcript_16870/m.23605 type:complete len:88 (-) Transcript_16870:37-300(-)
MASRASSNLRVAAALGVIATIVGIGYGSLSFHLHNKQMRHNYAEERRIAKEALALGNITRQEFDALHCNQTPEAKAEMEAATGSNGE